MARVALDAMGGDRAPAEMVAGAVRAAAAGVDVVLVGDRERLSALLDEQKASLPIAHAGESVGMGEDPARAIRAKRDSSVSVAARLVAAGEADAMVSAGSTGAVLAAASVYIGRSPRVARPAIALEVPLGANRKILIDGGANSTCEPAHLVQFALMGLVLARLRLGLEEPRVALLNIGEEPGKGRSLEKAAYDLLAAAPIRFSGNIEGRQLASDTADVIVTDGFSGNLVLKAAEGAIEAVTSMVVGGLQAASPDGALPKDLEAVLEGVRARLDHESYGGGSLVGVRGVVTIAHGSSSALAIANAVRLSAMSAESGLVEEISTCLAEQP